MADDHVVLDGRRLPAGTAVHFPLARLARDKAAWADPREFRPERFLAGGEGEGVSLVAAAGSAGEIRMMPFGAGAEDLPGHGRRRAPPRLLRRQPGEGVQVGGGGGRPRRRPAPAPRLLHGHEAPAAGAPHAAATPGG